MLIEVHRLLSFVMKHNFLIFNAEVYQQIQGTCMGTSSAVVFACLFMAILEQSWIEEFQSKLALFRRFIDDGFGIFIGTEDEAKSALLKYDSLHPNINIEYTTSTTSAIFLDLNLYIDSSNPTRIQVSCFQKSMNKYLYLPFSSFHDDRLKQNFVRGELIRYLRNNSQEGNFKQNKVSFFGRLRARGYPTDFLLPIFLGIKFSDRTSFLYPNRPAQNFISEQQPVLVQEKNLVSLKLNARRFFKNVWFDSIIPVNDNSEQACFLRRLPRPLILTKYPPNMRQHLIRSEFNGFQAKSKTFWSIFQRPKHMLNPFESLMDNPAKRFKQ